MGTIEFTEEAVKEYLDDCIRLWREYRDVAHSYFGPDPSDKQKFIAERQAASARNYIDAYQSVRSSLFGEPLD
jgi:hypothetical protein